MLSFILIPLVLLLKLVKEKLQKSTKQMKSKKESMSI